MAPKTTILIAGISLLVGGCASDQGSGGGPPAPSGLASAASLAPDKAGSWTYVAPTANLARYRRFMVLPGEVYQGREADFGSADAGRRQRYAAILTEELRNVLGERYQLVGAAGPDVLALKPTLIGVEPTVGGLATATRVIPVGAIANLAKGAAGGSGTFTGSLTVAIEAFDSSSRELVAAAVRTQAPAVFDIQSTFSTEDTVRASARAFARQVREAMDQRQRR
jgi:Protein of unknown function (DUF3313)